MLRDWLSGVSSIVGVGAPEIVTATSAVVVVVVLQFLSPN